MSKDGPQPPSVPKVAQEMETGTGHLAWTGEKDTAYYGVVFLADSCGDQLRYLLRDIREAAEISSWCGRCASVMIHE